MTHFKRFMLRISASQVLFFTQVSHVALLCIFCTKLSVNLHILEVNLIYRFVENRLKAPIHLFGGRNIDCKVIGECGFCFWEARGWYMIVIVIIWVQAFSVWWLSCLKFYTATTLTITIPIALGWAFSLWICGAFHYNSFYPRTHIALLREISIS